MVQRLVQELYAGLLERRPDPSGAESLQGVLARGARLADVLHDMTGSPEFLHRILPQASRAAGDGPEALRHLYHDATDAAPYGNPLRIWSGPPVAFLHLEKTAGNSVLDVLLDRFHPLQINRDPGRTRPPHLYLPCPEDAAPALIWGHYDLPTLRRLGGDRFIFTFLREPAERILSLYHFWRSQDPAEMPPDERHAGVRAAQALGLADFLRSRDPEVRDHIDNLYARRLTGCYATGAARDPLMADPEGVLADARAALAGLDFVGVTEAFDAGLAALAARLGLPPVREAPRVNVLADMQADPGTPFRPLAQEPVTPVIRAALDQLTRLDARLYAIARAAALQS
ncbi:MAG TPA: DUF4214 domain-containing protein [Acetobacteraceae bacterium]|nr:DUF4214 domain-containing protein [Acetobacteraceae bacterium]